MATLEVLEAQFKDHQQKCDKEKDQMNKEVDKIWTSLGKKLSIERFTGTIAVLLTIIMSIFGYIVVQISNLDVKIAQITSSVVETQKSTSFLEGQWQQWTKTNN